MRENCPNCQHPEPHDASGLGVCRHADCGCDDTREVRTPWVFEDVERSRVTRSVRGARFVPLYAESDESVTVMVTRADRSMDSFKDVTSVVLELGWWVISHTDVLGNPAQSFLPEGDVRFVTTYYSAGSDE